MPLYEYRCRDCGAEFEVLQSIGADGKDLECPRCGVPGPDKQLSTFACSDDGGTSSFGGDCTGFT